MQNKAFGTAFLIFLIVAGWYASSVIGDLNSWSAWDQPAEFAKLLKAVLFGLGAMAMALGIDLKSMLGPLGSFLPTGTTPPPDDTKKP